MIKAYLYPNIKRNANPYINEFITSLSSKVEFCNLKKSSGLGIFNVFMFLGKIDIIFFNWIEDVPDKRGGYLQSLALVILIMLTKILGIKIFYTLHNKESHHKTSRYLKKFLMSLVIKNADYVLCHSTEGKEILRKLNVPVSNIQYHPHPFYTNQLVNSACKKEYDILIWGTIQPYKGIDRYLKYLESRNLLSRFRTKIAGKIVPASYEKALNPYKSEYIEIENNFLDNDRLDDLIDKSRIVLFTYEESSILSSGAVIYSLGRGANVIGPNAASFQDLYNEGLIKVYNDFDELISLIDIACNHSDVTLEKIAAYIEANTWSRFGIRILEWIRK